MKSAVLLYCLMAAMMVAAQDAQIQIHNASEEGGFISLKTFTIDTRQFANDHPLQLLNVDHIQALEAPHFLPLSKGKKFLLSTRDVVASYAFFLSILFAAPPGLTKWGEPFGQTLFSNAGERFHAAWTTPPVMDGDTFFTNFISHPHAGSFYYNSMRTKGSSAAASFRFALFSSTLWEYGPEAFFEQPSIQDLIVTPIVGSVVGELVHRMTLKMSKDGFTTGEKILVFILNPSWVLNHGFSVPSDVRSAQLRDMKNQY